MQLQEQLTAQRSSEETDRAKAAEARRQVAEQMAQIVADIGDLRKTVAS